MIPYDTDPSLHTGEPEPAVLDDGFSPPPERQPVTAGTAQPEDSADAAQDLIGAERGRDGRQVGTARRPGQ